MHAAQAVARLVEICRHVRREFEGAIKAIRPLVIGADDIADIGRWRMQQAGAAVAADVVKGVQFHVVVARDDNGVRTDIDGHAVAFVGHVRFDADIDPVASEDDVQIGAEDRRVGVERRFERLPGLAAGEQGAEVGGHGWDSIRKEGQGSALDPLGTSPQTPLIRFRIIKWGLGTCPQRGSRGRAPSLAFLFIAWPSPRSESPKHKAQTNARH